MVEAVATPKGKLMKRNTHSVSMAAAQTQRTSVLVRFQCSQKEFQAVRVQGTLLCARTLPDAKLPALVGLMMLIHPPMRHTRSHSTYFAVQARIGVEKKYLCERPAPLCLQRRRQDPFRGSHLRLGL